MRSARVDNLVNLHYENLTRFLVAGLGVFGGIRVASYGAKWAAQPAGMIT